MATAAAAAANAAIRAADAASRAAARPINAATGGQGGTVLLIVGVLFVGYLFLTRKLQRVLQVIDEPADAGSGIGAPAPKAGGSGGIAEHIRRNPVKPPPGMRASDSQGQMPPQGEWRPKFWTPEVEREQRNVPADAGYRRFGRYLN